MRAVNLIPSDSRPGATPGFGRSGGTAYAVLAVIGGLAILALLYGIANHQVSSRRTQAASLSAQAQRAEAEAAQLAPYTTFIALRQQRMQAVSDLVDARFDWAHAFHELGRVLPHDASISSLQGTVGSAAPAAAATPAPATPATPAASPAAAPVSSATPPGSVPIFTLSGCATTQAQVAHTLQRLRLIDGVSEVTLQSSTKPGAAGAGGGAAGGNCEGNSPAFTIQVSFDALPSSAVIGSATAKATKLTSQTGVAR